MSNTAETILLTVDIQANNGRLVELQKQLNENKAALLALNQASKEGRISADELAAGQLALASSSKTAQNEVRILTAANQAQQKATDAAKGSIEQLRAQLALGTAAYNKLSQEERDNTAAGQKLQAGNKAISDSLKTLEKAVGDTRRNVGNYKDDVVAALKETNLFGVNVGQTANNLKGGLTQGLNIAKAGFGSLKAAIVSTGIGALVILLGSVYEYLKKSDEGAEKLAGAMAGFGAAVDVVTGYVIRFGEYLVNAFTKPQEAIKNIGKFLVDIVTNPRKAFTSFIATIENGFDRAKTQISAAVDAGKEASRLGNKLEDAEIAAIARNAEAEKQIGRLTLSARDRSKAETERLANLAKADVLEQQVLNRNLDVERLRLKIIADKNQRDKENSKLQDSDRRKQQEQIAKISQLEGAAAEAQQGRQNRRAALIAEIAAEALSAAQAVEAAEKARLEAIAKEAEAADKARVQAAQRAEKARLDAMAADKAAYDSDVAMLERNLEQRRIALDTANSKGEISKKAYEARLYVIENGGYAARIVLAKHHNQDVSALENAQTRAHNIEIRKQTDEEIDANKRKLAGAEEFGKAVGSAYAQTLLDSGQSLEDFASKTLIIILDSLEKVALAKAAESAISNIATYGPILGPLKAALEAGLITVAFETAKGVLSQGGKKAFATGGYVSGAGTGTSDSINAQLSNGESVINANSTSQFKPLLSYLNVLGGGASFSNQAPGIPRQLDGGLMARSIGNSGFPTAAEIGAAVAANVPTEIDVRRIGSEQAKLLRPRVITRLGG